MTNTTFYFFNITFITEWINVSIYNLDTFANLPDFIQIRVSGVVVFENDMEIKEQIINDRPFLKPIVEKVGYDAIIVFRVQNLVATPWTMATNIEPKEYIELT